MFDLIDERLTVEGEPQGLTHRGIGNLRVREVEIDVVVGVTRLPKDGVLRKCFDPLQIRAAKLIPHVDVVRSELREQSVTIGHDLIGDLIELRAPVPIERVCDHHDLLRTVPALEISKLPILSTYPRHNSGLHVTRR